MKLQNKKRKSQALHLSTVLQTTLLGLASLGATSIARAQDQTQDSGALDEIIVTARRTDETLQTVPISMTVYDQKTLNERNVVSATDLANSTPSLAVNTRFGSDQATFAIRGFTQELRTAASVAVYFADVVAPRGGGAVTAGDGAGPGAFFDLQNVQILKGPQGTLFGRNTTGGAIQLVPQEPTSELEGYLEMSVGNYGMQRTQGVINVPISDTARARFGIDKMDRDGYLDNKSGIGPDDFADVGYVAGRASLIMDLADTVENYSILTYTNSENHGGIAGLFACRDGGTLAAIAGCQTLLNHQGTDFYAIENDTPDPYSKLKQWQAINTTTWNVTDEFTVKNIISYADLEQTSHTSTFGTDFLIADNPAAPTRYTHMTFYPTSGWPGIPTNSQTTFVEEIQLAGDALDGDMTWQAGLYYENSKPDGVSGARSQLFLDCNDLGSDPAAWQCRRVIPYTGAVASNLGKIEYTNQAAYAQTTYNITDEFRATGGLRYTVDETRGTGYQQVYEVPVFPAPAGAPTSTYCMDPKGQLSNGCAVTNEKRSEAPTWLLGLDYLPSTDLMWYAKYARGYRQGSVTTVSVPGFESFDPEKVDAYELGVKTSFHGVVSGTLNVAAFYNKLKDQQIQVGYQDLSGQATPTTVIINAGSSTIQGVELETRILLTEGLVASVSYTYLETHVDEFKVPEEIPPPFTAKLPAAVEGGELTFSPRHNVTAALNYQLPVPADLGDISIGVNYTYVSEQYATANSPSYGELDSHFLVGANASWSTIAGSNFDAALFVTNLTNEEYTAYTPGLYDTFAGLEFRTTGEPRMYGARIRYNFGS